MIRITHLLVLLFALSASCRTPPSSTGAHVLDSGATEPGTGVEVIDTRRLAEAHINDCFDPEELEPVNADAFGPAGKARFEESLASMAIVMGRGADTIDTVADFGILSLFETGGSNANPSFAKRKKVEGFLLRGQCPLPWNPVSLHSKSAFLVPNGVENYTVFQERYGDMLLVFKPDVQRRATFTLRDSYESSVAFPFNPSAVARRFAAPTYVQETYWEAQLWGRIDLSDVSEVYVHAERFNALRTKFEAVQARFGFTVHTFQWQPIPGTLYAKVSQVAKNVLQAQATDGTAAMQRHTSEQLIARYKQEEVPEGQEPTPASTAITGLLITRLGEVGDTKALTWLKEEAAKHEISTTLSDAALTEIVDQSQNSIYEGKERLTILFNQALRARKATRTWLKAQAASNQRPKIRDAAKVLLDEGN